MSFRRPYLSKQQKSGGLHPGGSRFAWRNVSEPYRSLVASAALILLIGLWGHMNKVDVDNELKSYCKLVHEGYQPDYNKSYQRQCSNGEPKQ